MRNFGKRNTILDIWGPENIWNLVRAEKNMSTIYVWRRKWQPTLVLFPGESHGGRSLVGYSPWGRRVRYDWMTSLYVWKPLLVSYNLAMSFYMWFTVAYSLVCSLIKCSLRLLFSEEALFLVLDKLQNKVPEFAVLYCEEVGNNKLTDMLRRWEMIWKK